MTTQTQKNKPARKMTLGAVQIAVWLNQTDDGKSYYSVSVSRRYKDGDGWKDSNSFKPSDLLNLGKAIEMAFDFIASQQVIGE
jgi:hypothetical protein